MIKTYGRTTIYANFSENDILNSIKKDSNGNYDLSSLNPIIIDILENSKAIHENNKTESEYLIGYEYGDQDIKDKVKYSRPEINNKTVENWAWALIDFKKSNLLGKPIQYVQLNDTNSEEISKLNDYVKYEHKQRKDMELFEDMLAVGRGFRYTNKDPQGKEDETPFEIINCPICDTEVVYSSKLGNEQLFSFIDTGMKQQIPYTDDNGQVVTKDSYYDEYTVYLRNLVITYNNKTGVLSQVGNPIPLLWNKHIITEYKLNRKRISLIEIGKDLFNDINYLESLDKDDMEQFVNAIMIFTNVEVSDKEIDEIKELGAVCINSTDAKKASIELLQGRLNATDTQTYYQRLLTALHQILAVPTASDSGSVTSGDTGRAKLTGQGFTSAGIRSQGDETMFKESDFKSLDVILSICKQSEKSGIKSLKISDIDSNFQRDKSENLLVKTQALQTLYECDIPRETANSIIELFADPNAVAKQQEKLFGKQVSKQGAKLASDMQKGNNIVQDNTNKANKANVANAQLNKINNAMQIDTQGQ